MLYLFSKILFCLAVAAGLGGVIGWLLRGSGRRDQLAEIEAGWRRRLDTTEKERLALAVERDRLVRENASLKSLHSGCRPRIEELEDEIQEARQAHDHYDEEITRLKMSLQVLQDRGEPKATDRTAPDKTQPTHQASPPAHEDDEMYDLDLPLPQVLEPGKSSEEAADRDQGASEGEQPGDSSTDEARETEPPSATAAPTGLLDQPQGEADNLKKIKGIGRVLEKTLNELGIFHFRQIARLTEDETAWVAKSLKTFPDRIHRDRWVEQAADLHQKKYGDEL